MKRKAFIPASLGLDAALSAPVPLRDLSVPTPLAGEGQGGGYPTRGRRSWLPPSPTLPRKGGGGAAPSRWQLHTISSSRASYFAGCGVGEVPKSTFGAVEISFSF